MKKLLLTRTALLPFAAASLAQSNMANVSQLGNNNTSTITQIGHN